MVTSRIGVFVNALRPGRVVARPPFLWQPAVGTPLTHSMRWRRMRAETLINWFPETTYNRLRRGYTEFCDIGGTIPVTALAAI